MGRDGRRGLSLGALAPALRGSWVGTVPAPGHRAVNGAPGPRRRDRRHGRDHGGPGALSSACAPGRGATSSTSWPRTRTPRRSRPSWSNATRHWRPSRTRGPPRRGCPAACVSCRVTRPGAPGTPPTCRLTSSCCAESSGTSPTTTSSPPSGPCRASAPGAATSILDGHRRPPDATPAIRAEFEAVGFTELAFEAPAETVMGVDTSASTALRRPSTALRRPSTRRGSSSTSWATDSHRCDGGRHDRTAPPAPTRVDLDGLAHLPCRAGAWRCRRS